MKTNIVKLAEETFGIYITDAMYYSYGTCEEDAEIDYCNIYRLLDGNYVAEANGVIFDVKETNWCGHIPHIRNRKRGRHSHSNNKQSVEHQFVRCRTDELPF